MPSRLALTYGGEVYDRTRLLYSGQVTPEGVDLRYIRVDIEELFWRQGRYGEFDAAEFSFGAYLASAEDPGRRFVAIPVFPSKLFRHSAIYVNAASRAHAPAELSGGRIGTPEWSMTASLWMRGILGEHYGVDLSSVHWRTGGLEQPGRQEKSRVVPPAGYDVEHIGTVDTLSGLLLAGDLDAVITARPPAAFLQGDPRIRRLFRDYRAEEQAFYRTSGVVPLMHVVVIRRELCEREPWLANTLRHAFEQARRPALPALHDSAVCSSSLIWESAYAEEQTALLGDPFRYGVEANRPALEAILRYAAEQGFTSRRLELEEIFVPSTLTDSKV